MVYPEYVILVRSYKRHNIICQYTLALLERNNVLDITYLMVATEEEKELYEKALEENNIKVRDIVVTEIGAANSTNNMLDRLPIGQKLLMLDDDIKEITHYPTGGYKKELSQPLTNLLEYMKYGLRICQENEIKLFGIDYTNMFYKQGKEFATIGQYRFGGAFICAINCEELQPHSNHEEDNIRSSQILDKYHCSLKFNWFTMNVAPIGVFPGGMQSDRSSDKEEQLQYTKRICEELLTDRKIKKYFRQEPIHDSGADYYTLKMKHIRELKKSGIFIEPIKIKEYFGELEKINTLL